MSRGFGAVASIIFTISTARILNTVDSAKWFFILNAITIVSVCLRWGYDEIIVKNIASTLNDNEKINVIKKLFSYSIIRIILNALLVSFLYGIITSFLFKINNVQTIDFIFIILSSVFLSLSVCVGRIFQGFGLANLSAFVMTIIVPLLSTAVIFALHAIVPVLNYNHIAFVFLFSVSLIALVPYQFLVKRIINGDYVFDSVFKNIFNFKIRYYSPIVRSANYMGFVVLAQQLLQWGGLLLVPLIFPPDAYNAYVVAQKTAMSVSIVALIINFSIINKIAVSFKTHSYNNLQLYLRVGSLAIVVISMAFAFFAYYMSDYVFLYSKINYVDRNAIFAMLLIGQVAFGLSSFFAIFLTMSSQEFYLTKVIMFANIVGIILFYFISLYFGLVFACSIFVVAYVFIALLLAKKIFVVIDGSNIKSNLIS